MATAAARRAAAAPGAGVRAEFCRLRAAAPVELRRVGCRRPPLRPAGPREAAAQGAARFGATGRRGRVIDGRGEAEREDALDSARCRVIDGRGEAEREDALDSARGL